MILSKYIAHLQENFFANRSDALEFASHATGVSYYNLSTHMSEEVTTIPNAEEELARVKSGEPLAYVLNNKNFYGEDFYVDESVLIPRPETELLVEHALDITPEMRKIRILDICTGSGCILTTLLMNLPEAIGVGLDISDDALKTAQINLEKHCVADRATLVQGDALEINTLDLGTFDLITCNPPYLSDDEWEGSDKSLKYEPKIALSSGVDALLFYKKLMDMTPDLCNKNGGVLFEIGMGQYGALIRAGYAEKYHVTKDYQHIERVLSWINL